MLLMLDLQSLNINALWQVFSILDLKTCTFLLQVNTFFSYLYLLYYSWTKYSFWRTERYLLWCIYNTARKNQVITNLLLIYVNIYIGSIKLWIPLIFLLFLLQILSLPFPPPLSLLLPLPLLLLLQRNKRWILMNILLLDHLVFNFNIKIHINIQ